MKRCAICDYLEGHGAEWLGLGPDKRRVIWRHAHKEYQCDECFTQIREAKAEKELEDAIKALELPDEYDEVCEAPTPLSKMPF